MIDTKKRSSPHGILHAADFATSRLLPQNPRSLLPQPYLFTVKVIAMSNLTVIEFDGVLVVDSRLIAERLGVEHESFMKTLKKHLLQAEQAFGVIRFEIGKPQLGTKGGRPEVFAWLTEEQATFYMTLSRNTLEVVQCKVELVNAFFKAKQIIPAQSQEIERLKLELELAQTQERLMQTTNAIATMHGSGMVALILGKPEAVITKTEVVEKTVLVDERGKAIAVYRKNGFKASPF